MLTCTEEYCQKIIEKANFSSDSRGPPQKIVDQILSIAPILPGQQKKQSQPTTTQPSQPSNAQLQAPAQANKQSANLIDLDSRPSSTAPPGNASSSIAGNPLHPTSNPKQISSGTLAGPSPNQAASGNLLDDTHILNDKMSKMTMQQPLQPKPIKRTDTETSEVDEFVDAQG